jgi:hypothetical protein
MCWWIYAKWRVATRCLRPGDRQLLLLVVLQEDGIDALEEVTNGNVMPGGKKLRSDDPNFKSNEQIR